MSPLSKDETGHGSSYFTWNSPGKPSWLSGRHYGSGTPPPHETGELGHSEVERFHNAPYVRARLAQPKKGIYFSAFTPFAQGFGQLILDFAQPRKFRTSMAVSCFLSGILFLTAPILPTFRSLYQDADGTMQCFVWHKDQKAVCHCLAAILNVADDSNKDASS